MDESNERKRLRQQRLSRRAVLGATALGAGALGLAVPGISSILAARETTPTGETAYHSRTATLVVAASNASPQSKLGADFVCDGTADEVQINAAIAALPAGGGKVVLTEGIFNITDSITITGDAVHIEGQGRGYSAGPPVDGRMVTYLKVATAFNKPIIDIDQASQYGYTEINDMFIGTIGGTQQDNHTAIDALDSRMVLLHDLTIYGVTTAIKIEGGGVAEIFNVWGRGLLRRGIYMLSGSDNYLRDCQMEGRGEDHYASSVFGYSFQGSGWTAINLFADNFIDGIVLDTAPNVLILGGHFSACRGNGVKLVDSDSVHVIGVRALNNGKNTGFSDADRSGIRLYNSDDCMVTACRSQDDQGTKTQKYGIYEDGTSDRNNIFGNNVLDNDTAGMLITASDTRAHHNIGYLTENSGTDTIADGRSSKQLAHGLAATPTSVVVTPRGDPGASGLWVSARDGTNITVSRNGAGGALDFDWYAEST